jgi:hypothetical protein
VCSSDLGRWPDLHANLGTSAEGARRPDQIAELMGTYSVLYADIATMIRPINAPDALCSAQFIGL